jgi:thioredoxin-related protein
VRRPHTSGETLATAIATLASGGRPCASSRAARRLRVKNLMFMVAAIAAVLTAHWTLADPAWRTDYKTAQVEAKTTNKLLLLNFTGSDWCGYCILLDREILSQPQFREYAKKNLILMEIDFPRRKPQTDETKRQNQELAMHYQVEGFPTVVVLNGEGKPVWRFEGYFPDGPEAFIAQLEKLRNG